MAERHHVSVTSSRADLIALRDAAAANAANLVEDARLLFKAERWAGTHGIATLALEEVGKAWLCHQKLVGLDGITLKDLRSDHVHKAIAARQFIETAWQASQDVFNVNEVYGEHHDFAAEYSHSLRLTGLYVDLEDSEVVGGAGSVTKDKAEESLMLACIGARLAATLHRWKLPDGEPGSDTSLVGKPLKPPKK